MKQSKSKITECLINIELAVAIRDMTDAVGFKPKNGNVGFRCPKCKNPVKVVGEHFEHLKRNPDCPLSHKSSNSDLLT